MKICPKCLIDKELNLFNNNKNRQDRLSYHCKDCVNKDTIKYKRTKVGLISKIYSGQKSSSKARGDKLPNYTKTELQDWLYKQPNFEKLYNNWANSGYKEGLAPSCDRLDDYKGYSFDNIRLITWEENRNKGCTDMKNGINNKQNKSVIGTCIKTGKQILYHSISEAERQTGIAQTSISQCCNGKLKTTGKHIWTFVNL